jgi:hypothetical protein
MARTVVAFFRPSWSWFQGSIVITAFVWSFAPFDRDQRGDGGENELILETTD